MRIEVNKYNQRVLIPSEDKWLLRKEEQEQPVEERNYSQCVYIADVLTLEDCENMYIEADLEVIDENQGTGEFIFG